MDNLLRLSAPGIHVSVMVAKLDTRVAKVVVAPSGKNVKVMKVFIGCLVYQQKRFQGSVYNVGLGE